MVEVGNAATVQPALRDHIRYLDGLRGVAILMVVMVHVSLLTYLPGFLHGLTAYGVRGVQLFFIVSGLTLTMTHKDRPLHLANFAARRFFRIAPMFYAGILFYLVLGATTDLPFVSHDADAREVLVTLAFVHDWSLTANNKVVPGGWSIACEAMFYLAFPFLLLALRRLGTGFWPILVLIYVLGGASNLLLMRFVPGDPGLVREFARNFWLTQLPAFASGCWLALNVGYGKVTPRTAGWVAIAAILALLVDSQLRGRSNLLVAIALLSVLVWAVGRARPAILESRPMTFLGEISFSVYLIHFFIAALLSYVAQPLNDHLGPGIAFILLFVATLALTIPIATLTYRRVERPFIQFSRRLFMAPAPARAP